MKNSLYRSVLLCVMPFFSTYCAIPLAIAPSTKKVDFSVAGPYLGSLTQHITPETTIFAFDLHEVLFRRNFRRIGYGGLKLFCKLFFYTLFNPSLVPRMITVSQEDIATEGIFSKLCEEYPYLNNFQPDMCEIANGCCRPIEPMINLLRALKKQGFKIFLLSNLGENALHDFKQRFPYFEGLFDGFYSPCKKNDYICKPNQKFYEGFKSYLHSLGYRNKQIVFIDDLEKNIVAASNSGIGGIQFIGYPNLCDTLNKLGVVLGELNCSGVK